MRIVILLVAMAAPLAAGDLRTLTWSELSREVTEDSTVRVTLADGTAVEGKPVQFQAEALTMQVNHTGNKSMHPKGPISVPRPEIQVLGLRQDRHRGRIIGTLVPIGAGIGIAAAMHSASRGEYLEDVFTALGITFGAAVAVVGGTVGYFIGRHADHRFETVVVIP